MKRCYHWFWLCCIGFLSLPGQGQIAAWNFYGTQPPALVQQDAAFWNPHLDGSSMLTRGAGAAPSAANHSFRTQDFGNDGIAVTNTDYFEFSVSAAPGYILSIDGIQARFAGTASYYASPGVTNQFAYSLDGSNFILAASPTLINSLGSLHSFDFSGIGALQNIEAGVIVTFRYYASGQTSTGGWGFYSSSASNDGLTVLGSVAPALSVFGNGMHIADSSEVVSEANLTDFGSICRHSSSSYADRSFQLVNNGSTPMVISGVTTEVFSVSPVNFTRQTVPPITIPPSGTQDLIIRFSPTNTGLRNARVRITTGSLQYTFVVSGHAYNPPAFLSGGHPPDRNVTSGSSTNFSVTTSAGTAAAWQWQVSTDGGANWNNLTEGGIYSGTNTATLLLSNTTTGMNNYRYRAVVTGFADCGSITSNAGLLTVNPGSGFCLEEEFAGGITAPPGWTFNGISGTYSGTGDFGNNAPSIRFDDTNDFIETPYTGTRVAEIRFWLKGFGANAASALQIEGFNGSSWVAIRTITNIPATQSEALFAINRFTDPVLDAESISRIRFRYSKSAGNIGVDDVQLVCEDNLACPETYYRTNGSGNWTTASVWQISADGLTGWKAACTFPQAYNAARVTIRNGDSVAVNARIIQNHVIVEPGATLATLSAGSTLRFVDGNGGADFELAGTHYNHSGNAPNGVFFMQGAAFEMAPDATLIKTNSQSPAGYIDNYFGGISNIPASANWRYRFIGQQVTTRGANVYYPNLYIESITAAHAFSQAEELFSGSQPLHIKGNLFIGENGIPVNIHVINTGDPVMVEGNTVIGSGSKLLLDNPQPVFFPNTQGTGFDFKGNISLSDNAQIIASFHPHNANSGIYRLSGSATQTIAGPPSAQIQAGYMEVNNPAGVFSQVSTTISHQLLFTNGLIYTQSASPLTLEENAEFAGAGMGRFIDGPVRKRISNTAMVEFPVGEAGGAINSGYRPMRFEPTANTGTVSAEYAYSIPPSPGSETFHGDLIGLQNNEYWHFDRIAGDIRGRVKLYYLFPGANTWRLQNGSPTTVHYTANVAVAQRNLVSASQWQWAFTKTAGDFESDNLAALETTHHLNSDTWLQTAELSSFSPFTFAYSLPIILDMGSLLLKLESFTVHAEGSKVRLAWEVNDLQHLLYAEIEISRDGWSYQRLTTIASGDQEFHHRLQSPGVYHFRIRLHDRLGNQILSNTQQVEFRAPENSPGWIFENGTRMGRLQWTVPAAGKSGWILYNAQGQMLRSGIWNLQPGYNEQRIYATGLPNGAYLLILQIPDGKRMVFRFALF